MKRSIIFALTAILLFTAPSTAEEKVLKDIAYDDDHASQKLDVYPAGSDKPAPVMVFIHGGGWRKGSKSGVPAYLLKANKEGWLAVVSVEYRFTDVAVHPAQVNDCSRAIQFVRHNAKKWNIDPDRIAVTGGSAGGHLSAYTALRDDRAKPDSKDPVERLSSRVMFAIPFAGPTDWKVFAKAKTKHPAPRELIGYKPDTPYDDLAAEKMKDVSPVSFVTKDDPPFLIVHGDRDPLVTIEHAEVLEAALKKAGVPVELSVIKGGNHGVAGAWGKAAKRADAYIREKFKAPGQK